MMDVVSYLMGKQVGGTSPAPTPTYQAKDVTISTNTLTKIEPDEGYDALSEVNVTTNVPSSGVDIDDYFNDTINFNTLDSKNYNYLVKKMPPLKITNVVTNLNYAFNGYRGEEIEFDFANSDISNVTTMSFMFQNCYYLKEIDMSGLISTNKITNINSMFNNCMEITKIDLSGLTIANNFNGGSAFNECNKLAILDISNIGKPMTSIPSFYQDMFTNCGTECLQSDGAYADGLPYVYVKDVDVQTWVLSQNSDWSTDNVVIKS